MGKKHEQELVARRAGERLEEQDWSNKVWKHGGKLAHTMVSGHLQMQWQQEEMSLADIHIQKLDSLFA